MKREYWVEDFGLEGEVLDPEYYDEAIVGVSFNGKAIYDFDEIVNLMVEHDEISEEEAIDWHEYNTFRSLPYLDNPPIIGYFKKTEK